MTDGVGGPGDAPRRRSVPIIVLDDEPRLEPPSPTFVGPVVLTTLLGALSLLPFGIAMAARARVLGDLLVDTALVVSGALLGASLRAADRALSARRQLIGGGAGFLGAVLAGSAFQALVPSAALATLLSVLCIGLIGMTGIGVAARGVRGFGAHLGAGLVSALVGFCTYALVWPTIYSPARYPSTRFLLERTGGAAMIGAFLALGMVLAHRLDSDAASRG